MKVKEIKSKMSLQEKLKELEKEINTELKIIGLTPINVDGVDTKNMTLQWTDPFSDDDMSMPREVQRLNAVVNKHFEEWLKKHPEIH